jgi:DNA-binding NarL/FixJ family response regulator
VIPVLVAASSPVIRAGLRATVEDLPDFVFAGAASSSSLAGQTAELEPGVILWQLSPDEDAAATLHSVQGTPVLVLAQHPSLDLIRAGARGVLPIDASAEQIGVGLRAAAADLVVLTPEAVHPNHAAAPIGSALTARETEVLRMIAGGLANKEIAYRLGISEHTVKFHVSALLGKLGAASRAEAIAIGIRRGAVLL